MKINNIIYINKNNFKKRRRRRSEKMRQERGGSIIEQLRTQIAGRL
jgi:hypothetical protein